VITQFFDQKKVLDNTLCGLEFEFYSTMDREKMGESLAKFTGKNYKVIDEYHSEFIPTDKLFKIEPDFSGGMKMCELITGPMYWPECREIMTKIMIWIGKNGWTDEKCAFQVNISFDSFKLGLKSKLSQLDRLKFCLGFDEDRMYKEFEERKKSLYARSIKQVIPINRFVFTDNTNFINAENYLLPNEKYYGVNFTKRLKEYLEFRYMGGRDYQNKIQAIIANSEYLINFTYQTLIFPEYTESDKKQLREILKKQKKVVDSFSDFQNFFLNFKKIYLLVDLKYNRETLKAFWNIIRNKLFDIIMFSKCENGTLNYDTDFAKFQLKGAKIEGAFNLGDMEFIDCELTGTFYNCEFWGCKVSNAHLHNCKLHYDNKIEKAKIMESSIETEDNTITKCYIDNKKLAVRGKIIGGIIRSGQISKRCQKDNVEIIENKKKKEGGISI
jgi:uncharacterized protein YjbI with pentapeptide repeats